MSRWLCQSFSCDSG